MRVNAIVPESRFSHRWGLNIGGQDTARACRRTVPRSVSCATIKAGNCKCCDTGALRQDALLVGAEGHAKRLLQRRQAVTDFPDRILP